MRKTAVIMAAGLALALAIRDARADTVLCRTKSGALIVKSKCGKKQTPVAGMDFGLRGDPGRGLAIVDSTGKEVGIRPLIFSGGYYYGYSSQASVLHKASDGIWIEFSVDGDGLKKRDVGPTDFIYADASCTGTRYLRAGGYYGTAPPGLSSQALVDKDGKAHYADPRDRQQLEFRFVETVPYYGAATPDEARSACTSASGAFLGDAFPCPSGGNFCQGCFCQNCCMKFAATQPGEQPVQGGAERTEDLGSFVPPFRLKHQ